MKTATTVRFRADHCGSLIRPQALRQARLDRHFGRIGEKELQAIEDECILDALKMQRNTGLGIVTDGEFRRQFWFSALFEMLRGLQQSRRGRETFKELQESDLNSNPELEPLFPIVIDKIERDKTRRHITAEEIAFLKKHAHVDFKTTIPSLRTLQRFMVGAFEKGVTDKVYTNPEEMIADLSALVESEVALAADSGVRYIQIDNPGYSRLMAFETREDFRARGEDPDELLRQEIAADNRLLAKAKRDGNITGIHICLGTFIGAPKRATGTRVNYDPEMVARVFEELDADVFTCEYSVRSGTMESLKLKPRIGKKIVALGVVNVLDREVETVDGVMRQIESASNYIDQSNLAVCNNCGFSGASVDAFIGEDIQRRKLETIVRSADRVWNSN